MDSSTMMTRFDKFKGFYFLAVLVFLTIHVTACTKKQQTGEVQELTRETETIVAPFTATSTQRSTPARTQPAAATVSPTALHTLKPTNTIVPSLTMTATLESPEVVINVNAAHCRYGPSKAYLHAADLYEGDRGIVQAKFRYSDWLYVKWDKINYRCWVSPYVVDLRGDDSEVFYGEIGLERIPSSLYSPPQNIRATRNDDMVIIAWDRVNMTEDDDRGYLIEAMVCQNGSYIWWSASIPDQHTTSYTIKDEAGCHTASFGKLFTVEKHGYTEPAVIPWPLP